MSEGERAAAVNEAVNGNADALQRLIVHYHEMLHTRVDRQIKPALRRHVDAEDVLQQVYVSAFGSVGKCSFDGPGGFYKWLETIALEKLAVMERDLRRQKRDIGRDVHEGSFAPHGSNGHSSYPDLFARFSASGSTPSKHLARKEAAAIVISSLARLTEDQRRVIQLRFLEDNTACEVATELDKSEAAVHMLVHRGLKTLRQFMDSACRMSMT